MDACDLSLQKQLPIYDEGLFRFIGKEEVKLSADYGALFCVDNVLMNHILG